MERSKDQQIYESPSPGVQEWLLKFLSSFGVEDSSAWTRAVTNIANPAAMPPA